MYHINVYTSALKKMRDFKIFIVLIREVVRCSGKETTSCEKRIPVKKDD